VCVCVHVCVCVWRVCVCMYVCMCGVGLKVSVYRFEGTVICIHTHACTYTHIHTSIHPYIHTYQLGSDVGLVGLKVSVYRSEGTVVVLDGEKEGEGENLDRMADMMGVVNALLCDTRLDSGAFLFVCLGVCMYIPMYMYIWIA
jgi:hypothetical protein